LDQLADNKNNDEKGPVGFHEEFMSNLNNFSLSWRNQALKELEKFGPKVDRMENDDDLVNLENQTPIKANFKKNKNN